MVQMDRANVWVQSIQKKIKSEESNINEGLLKWDIDWFF